ncbi:hypothetical protein AB69_1724 [Escherichia coli 1-110-08_S1_C3]|nr:hypothetical protein AB69_1724 [Escherichia coli 1-110-08_S1_C3]
MIIKVTPEGFHVSPGCHSTYQEWLPVHSLRHVLKITLIESQYALHNFALPALATDYV